nr:DUF456 domain-containing protein [Mesobacillus campisalis]
MADEIRNQDKPEYLTEPEHDVSADSLYNQTEQNTSGNGDTAVGANVQIPGQSQFDQASTVNTTMTQENQAGGYREETAAEIAAPVRGDVRSQANRGNQANGENAGQATGSIMGFSALALSILSLFVLPVLLGAAGIVLGFIARARGAKGLGNWAIGIGAISLVIGMFVLPFY